MAHERREAVSTAELLRCPFCGGDPVEDRELRDGYKDGEDDAYAYSVRCRTCAGVGGWGKSAASARRWWNGRMGPTRMAEERERVGRLAEEILRTWYVEGAPPKLRHIAGYLSEIRGVVVTEDAAGTWVGGARQVVLGKVAKRDLLVP